MSAERLVVGGGVAGLVLARRLALAGERVTVLERSDRLGGQVARQDVAGVALDAAAESFATRGGAVAALLDELGLAGDVEPPASEPAWVHRADDTSVPLPATALLGVPADPFAADVVRAIGRAAAWRASLDRFLPAGVGADATSLGELVRRRMGRGVVDGLVAPIVRGVHSREPDALAVEAASPRLREELAARGSLAAAVRALRAQAPAGSQVNGIRGGIFRLVDALVADGERLGVTFETGVAVEPDGPDAVRIGGRRRSGAVVWAAPAEQVPTRRITLVTLVVDAPALEAHPRGTGVLVASDAPGVHARALTHLTAKWRWVADALPGRHAVRLSYDGDRPASDASAVECAVADATAILGAPLETVLGATVRTWDRPSVRVDADAHVAATGEVVAGTGLATIVPHAERVARSLLEPPHPLAHTDSHAAAQPHGRMEP